MHFYSYIMLVREISFRKKIPELLSALKKNYGSAAEDNIASKIALFLFNEISRFRSIFASDIIQWKKNGEDLSEKKRNYIEN